MDKPTKLIVQPDEWQSLQAFTNARIALGSTGSSLPTKAIMEFRLAHAQAKDAVYSSLDIIALQEASEEMGVDHYTVKSKAANRDEYLQRPDLGRTLNETSQHFLQSLHATPIDISIIIADGLSASAININAITFIQSFLQLNKVKNYTLAPIILTTMARVAISDEIGHLLNTRLSIILIGERPGLSAADSMGAYITYNPQPGTTDEKRNCVSNIRNKGLPPALAAEKVLQLVEQALRLQLTGVNLKEDGNELLLKL